jgi:hypothetical protein
MSRVEHCHSNRSQGHCGDDGDGLRYRGESHDLHTSEGRDRFEEAVENDDVYYYHCTNEVVVAGGPRYDLDTEAGRRAFQADARDGEIDGEVKRDGRSRGCDDRDDDAHRVRYEGRSYDLDSERGRDRLEDAIENEDVRYNRATNVVRVNGERYDLDTEKGRRAFQADARDGELDGRTRRDHDDANRVRYEGRSYNLDSERGRDRLEDAIENEDVRYNRATNVVEVDGERYDLDTERGRRRFRADLRDGELDGR